MIPRFSVVGVTLAGGAFAACGDDGKALFRNDVTSTGGTTADAAVGAGGSGDVDGGGSGGTGKAGAGGRGGVPTACRSDKDCTASGLLCDPFARHCVECVRDVDCESDATCRAGVCDARVACRDSRDCLSAPDGRLICDRNLGDCVQCVAAADCDPGATCRANVCESAVVGSGGAAGTGTGGAVGSGGSVGAGGVAASGGIVGSGGALAGGAGGAMPGSGGSSGTGGEVAAGGALGAGGRVVTGGAPGSGGRTDSAGAWAACMVDTDCAGGRICTAALQASAGIQGPGSCVKTCSGTIDGCDPAPAGADPLLCLATFCVIPCNQSLTCPANFACNTTFGFCIHQ